MGVFVDFGRIFMHLLASITGTGSLGGVEPSYIVPALLL